MTKENRKYKSKYIPDKVKDIEEWKLSRRKFLGIGILAGTLVGLPSISVLSNVGNDNGILSQKQFSILTSVQRILFPSDGNGPGAMDVMADNYMLWVLSDVRMDPEEKEYIIDGIGWVDETAEENFSKAFSSLTEPEKEEVIATISSENWGSSWLSVILTFIFEALLCNPQYGGNIDSIGWDWLQHNPGYPRPAVPLLYPEILTTVSSNPD